MEIIILFVLVSTAISFRLLLFILQNISVSKVFTCIAEQLKITYKKQIILKRPMIDSCLDGCRLIFSTLLSLNYNSRKERIIEARLLYIIPFQFSIINESRVTREKKRNGQWDHEIGSDEFDHNLNLEGSREDLFLVLNQGMRRLLESALKNTVTLYFSNTEFRLQFIAPKKKDPVVITKIIAEMISRIRILEKTEDYTALLLENIENEKEIKVKINLIAALRFDISHKGIDKHAVYHHLLQDPSEIVKIHSAAAMGVEGLRLLSLYYSQNLPCHAKQLIIRKIGEFRHKDAQNFILKQLKDSDEKIVIAAIHALKNYKNREVLFALHRILEKNAINTAVQNEIKKVISSISKSLYGEEHGWLSVSEPDESGVLSILEEETENE